MHLKKSRMNKEVFDFCQSVETEFDLIPKERKEELITLRNYISSKFECPV